MCVCDQCTETSSIILAATVFLVDFPLLSSCGVDEELTKHCQNFTHKGWHLGVNSGCTLHEYLMWH